MGSPATDSRPSDRCFFFFCNGRKISDATIDPSLTLAAYLRLHLDLKGTKISCEEGGCGACTVMVSSQDEQSGIISHIAVNACLTPICSVYGKAVTTVEGIGNTNKLHPVQERIAKAHGSQCGFCTPGFVMSMYTLLRNNPHPSMKEIEAALEGNLCRCTGYRPIIEGYKTFTKGCCKSNQTEGQCSQQPVSEIQTDGAKGCCQSNQAEGRCSQQSVSYIQTDGVKMSSSLFRSQDFQPYDPSQDIIFPPELSMMLKRETEKDRLAFISDRATWYRPLTLSALLKLKASHPSARLVAGNSITGVQQRYEGKHFPTLIDITSISELHQLDSDDKGIFVGAAVTISKLIAFLEEYLAKSPGRCSTIFHALRDMMRNFAGTQIRNVATVGGNIMSASSESDLITLLMASGAVLHVASTTGSRTLQIDQGFLISPGRTTLHTNEVLTGVHIPLTRKNEYFYSYKQSSSSQTSVKAAMVVSFQDGTSIVEDIQLAFGGVSDQVLLAHSTMKALKSRSWNDKLLSLANGMLLKDLPDDCGGMGRHKQSMALGFFFKFYLHVLTDVISSKATTNGVMSVPDKWKSALHGLSHNNFKSTQLYQEVSPSQESTDPVGRPIVTLSSLQQATGEAKYLDDLPETKGEVHLSLVYSKSPHAKIRSIDYKDALLVEGVVDVVTAEDVPGNNCHLYTESSRLFAVDEVHCVGQVIAGILAKDAITARRARELVKIDYEELEPIFTIQEAIDKGSFWEEPTTIGHGDPDAAFETSDHVIEGEVSTGVQVHFYMETQCCLATPGEHQEIEVIISSQALTFCQNSVASSLGIPQHKIVCKTKRVGGGFGGKAYQSGFIASLTAVAAVKAKAPVRLVLDRHEDMTIMGKRHPFLIKYKVGFTGDGKLTAVDSTFYLNAGHIYDISKSVMITALLKFENAYKIPNVRVRGICCKTNLPSFTAFRAFGSPQSMLATETWMNRVARVCGISPERVREMNFYQECDVTHNSQVLENVTLSRCWKQCLAQSSFHDRRVNVDSFNKLNRWKKRGLAAVPLKYGVSYISIVRFLNQGGALVHVYQDGSVLLSHGGIELGQGLFTKMLQVASRTLGVPISRIHSNETSTDKVPNASGTAASTGTDLNGMAVKDACEKIMDRLKPLMSKNPTGKWEDWVSEAYLSRISLSATGFFRTPDLDYDLVTNTGRSFNYITYGAAVSEVEIDCLTGDHVIIRTDVVIDAGNSINPAIDVGQVEGAFTQGYGLYMLEDYRISPQGDLHTIGPRAYKMPALRNTPSEFNVSLLHNAANPRSICSSKGIGEPPLCLASSVFFAVKDAITSARVDANLSPDFRLDAPATPDRIRLACDDSLLDKTPEESKEVLNPAFIRP